MARRATSTDAAPTLFSPTPTGIPGSQPDATFDGILDLKRDQAHLARQLTRVYLLMADGKERTLREIADAVSTPKDDVSTQSASARLRDLRKLKFGGFQVDRRRVGRLNWYRVVMEPDK